MRAQPHADWPDIAWIAMAKPVNARLDLRAGLRIFQHLELSIKRLRAL
jgi:hypothetical protein